MSQTIASVPSTTEPENAVPDLAFDETPAKSSGAKWTWVVLILLAAIGVGAWYYFKHKGGPPLQFRTATVSRGDIVQEVTANGSLNPVKSVQVGAQVSGIIEKLYVDYNAKVTNGQLIARIEQSPYQKNLAQAQAQLAVAKAALELAEVNAKRADQLFKEKLISAADHDTAVADYHQAQATLQIQQASVERAQVDLSYTEIRAPISGVVEERAVDEGQTVASSFNTPKLFVIANDLTKMQIEAAVSEADVGGVEEGQRVNFTVDAFPNRSFYGKVQQVRFDPITNQNVVTYTAVVQVENPDLKLRPGMTATAKFVTGEKNNVLRVPNSALRFHPPPGANVLSSATNAVGGASKQAATVATDENGNPIPPWRAEGRRPNPGEAEKWMATLTPDQRNRFQQMIQQMRQRREGGGGGGGGAGGGASGGSRLKTDGPTTETAYVLVSGAGDSANTGGPVLKAVTVKAGLTDGSYTEIIDGLHEGDIVATGTSLAGAEENQPPNNPFSPFGRRR
jgi:HlyD family secretion protein